MNISWRRHHIIVTLHSHWLLIHNFQPEQLLGLSESEYTEIIRYVVGEYEEIDGARKSLANEHDSLIHQHQKLSSEYKQLSKKHTDLENLYQVFIFQFIKNSSITSLLRLLALLESIPIVRPHLFVHKPIQ